MKFFVAMCLVASATASFAAAERGIYDLQYLPTAGTIYGISNLGLVSGKIETSFGDTKVKGWSVNQEVGYAFTERFSLAAELSFQHIDTDSDINSPGLADTSDTTKGLSDPELNGRFRVLDSDYRVDLLSTFVIGTGDSETDGHESNAKDGGNSLSLGVEAGHKTESFQYVGLLNFNRVFESDDKDNGVTTTSDAHNEYLIGVAGLFKVAEKSFIKGNLSAEWDDMYEDENDAETTSNTIYNVGAEYQHLCTQDLLLRVGLNLTDLHSGGIDSYRLYTLVLGANYQF
jgi:hypothetical protein